MPTTAGLCDNERIRTASVCIRRNISVILVWLVFLILLLIVAWVKQFCGFYVDNPYQNHYIMLLNIFHIATPCTKCYFVMLSFELRPGCKWAGAGSLSAGQDTLEGYKVRSDSWHRREDCYLQEKWSRFWNQLQDRGLCCSSAQFY